MRCFCYLLFILLLFPILGYSQIVSGSIRNSEVSLSGALIENLETKIISVSDIKGNFNIKAAVGDTLIVSYISYKPDTIKIRNQTFTTVVLKAETVMLGDVFINGNRLTPLQRYLKNQIEYKEIYRIGNDSNIFFAGGGFSNGGIGLNIDALYSALSKEGKDARRMQATLTNDYHTDVVDSRFTKELVSKVTGYQGKQLEDFIVNNKPSYEFITQASDYDIIKYIERRMKGIVMMSDNPAPAKATSSGIKFKFGIPATSNYDHPDGAEFVPIPRP